MSFSGTLLRIEDGPDGDHSASNHPEQTYKRWRLVVRNGYGNEVDALTGRQDIIKRARELIGERVRVLRGGKLGIVGGISKCTDWECHLEDLVIRLEKENKMLREKAEAAVAQEQFNRNEANTLRAELKKFCDPQHRVLPK